LEDLITKREENVKEKDPFGLGVKGIWVRTNIFNCGFDFLPYQQFFTSAWQKKSTGHILFG